MEENQGNEGGGAVFQWNLGLFFQWNFRAAPAGVGSTPVTRAPRNPSGHRNHPRPGISPHGSQSKAELKNSIRICKKFRKKKKKKNPAKQRNPPFPCSIPEFQIRTWPSPKTKKKTRNLPKISSGSSQPRAALGGIHTFPSLDAPGPAGGGGNSGWRDGKEISFTQSFPPQNPEPEEVGMRLGKGARNSSWERLQNPGNCPLNVGWEWGESPGNVEFGMGVKILGM